MKNVFRFIALVLITVIFLLLFSGCVLVISSGDDIFQQGSNTQTINNYSNNNMTFKQSLTMSTTDEIPSGKISDLLKNAIGLLISLLVLVSSIIGTVVARGKAQKSKAIIDLIIATLKIGK